MWNWLTRNRLLRPNRAARGQADVKVSAGRRAGNRAANGNERNALRAQEALQGQPFDAVGMNRDIQRIAVIEAQPIMRIGLPESTHGHRPSETLREKSIHFGDVVRERPAASSEVTHQQDAALRGSFV